jgi:hypothetical protein
LNNFPSQLKYFHLKSLSNSSIDLSKLKDNQSKLELKEKLLIIIDAPSMDKN